MQFADTFDASTLWGALSRIPPRTAQLLRFRFIEGRSPDECAALYGISGQALEIHLLRAAMALRAALENPSRGPLLPADIPSPPDEWEREHARPLEQSQYAGLVASLQRHGPEIQRRSLEAALAERESPEARRAELFRRLALVGLIALALWLYIRNGR